MHKRHRFGLFNRLNSDFRNLNDVTVDSQLFKRRKRNHHPPKRDESLRNGFDIDFYIAAFKKPLKPIPISKVKGKKLIIIFTVQFQKCPQKLILIPSDPAPGQGQGRNVKTDLHRKVLIKVEPIIALETRSRTHTCKLIAGDNSKRISTRICSNWDRIRYSELPVKTDINSSSVII